MSIRMEHRVLRYLVNHFSMYTLKVVLDKIDFLMVD